MLTVSQLSKSFVGRALFDDVSLQVNRGDRIGATIGFLPQETAAAGDETVLERALAVSPELGHAQKVIKEHDAAVAGIADPGADAA